MAEKDINKQPESTEKDNKFVKFGTNNGEGGFHFHFSIMYIYLLIGGILTYMYLTSDGETQRNVDYSQFQKLTQQGYFDKVIVNAREAEASGSLTKDPGQDFKTLSDAYKQATASNAKVSVNTNLPSNDRFAEEVENWKSAEIPPPLATRPGS